MFTKEKVLKALYQICAFFSIIILLIITYFIFKNGIEPLNDIGVKNFLLGMEWSPERDIYGIFPMIAASIYVTFFSLVIGIPLGIGTAVFLSFYCPDNIYPTVRKTVDLMAGIPSVIYGFFGMVVLVPFFRNVFPGSGKTVFTASVLLGIMILPTIISISESAIRSVPSHFYEASLALGATKERSIWKVVLPAARSGISASIVLGMGRAVGETMAVIMVIGNQTVMPKMFSGARTLTANIALELGYAQDLHRGALIATALVLFLLVLLIYVIFSFIGDNDGIQY